jgi:hypothetical protein
VSGLLLAGVLPAFYWWTDPALVLVLSGALLIRSLVGAWVLTRPSGAAASEKPPD